MRPRRARAHLIVHLNTRNGSQVRASVHPQAPASGPRALGLRPDGEGWTIAVEAPDPSRRARHSILALQDAAVATSGDYRHWVEVQGRRLSHTMDPARGAPLIASPASVTVVARTCAEADAWATALTAKGSLEGAMSARR